MGGAGPDGLGERALGGGAADGGVGGAAALLGGADAGGERAEGRGAGGDEDQPAVPGCGEGAQLVGSEQVGFGDDEGVVAGGAGGEVGGDVDVEALALEQRDDGVGAGGVVGARVERG